MIHSSFWFANITSKMEIWLLASAFILYLPICMKFMKPCRTDIKILLELQQDVRTYAGSLIDGVRLQVNVWDKWLEKSFSALLHCSEKKNLKKMSLVLDGHFREGGLNFNCSIASIKSNYGDIFYFRNKLKFDDSNICKKLLIREHKRSHVWCCNILRFWSTTWSYKYLSN